MKLNLGCADTLLANYINVDIAPPPQLKGYRPDPVPTRNGLTLAYPVTECDNGALFQFANLNNLWPWADSSVEHVLAQDVIEHLKDRIQTMNELWRVMKPGAQAEVIVPNAYRGAGFYQDPTHVSPWCMNSFQYFEDGSFARGRLGDAYGIKARFKIVLIGDREYSIDPYEPVWKIHALLEAVK